MNQSTYYNGTQARQQDTPTRGDTLPPRDIDPAATGPRHPSRRALISRVRDHVRRPSRLREFVTPDTPSRLHDIGAPELAREDSSNMVSIPPDAATADILSTQISALEVSLATGSRNSQVHADPPKTITSSPPPPSVKNITCHWWATKVCRYTEEECLYAHTVQKTIGDQPRKLNPNRSPVAGRNAHLSRPIHRDWRSAHQLPSSSNDSSGIIISNSSQPQAPSLQLSDSTQDIEPEIEALKTKRGISENAIADICDKVESELRRGRELQSQLGYFEAVPLTEIIMNWVTAVNEIVRQHRIIIDSINEKLMAMGRL